MTIWKVTYTEDEGDTRKSVSIPAKTYTDAYIETSFRLPKAIILEIEDSDFQFVIQKKCAHMQSAVSK